MAEAARLVNEPRTLEDTLDAIMDAARISIPSFDHVGVSVVHRDGRLETKSASGQLVWELDALQYDLDEGPCVTAMREETFVVAEDIQHEQRWRRYVPSAIKAGLSSQMAVHLENHERTLGGLNFYSTFSATISVEDRRTAKLFATHASLALAHARRESELNSAIDSRKLIGQAIGLTMRRFEIDEERAFHFLVRASSTGNIKVRDIAQELVDEANLAYRPTAQ